MSYEVTLLTSAIDDLAEAFSWVSRHAPITSAVWLGKFKLAMGSLSENPERCQFAKEAKSTKLPVREFHYGKRPNVFRVIFWIESNEVFILFVRRAQRRALSKKSLDEAINTIPRKPPESDPSNNP